MRVNKRALGGNTRPVRDQLKPLATAGSGKGGGIQKSGNLRTTRDAIRQKSMGEGGPDRGGNLRSKKDVLGRLRDAFEHIRHPGGADDRKGLGNLRTRPDAIKTLGRGDDGFDDGVKRGGHRPPRHSPGAKIAGGNIRTRPDLIKT